MLVLKEKSANEHTSAGRKDLISDANFRNSTLKFQVFKATISFHCLIQLNSVANTTYIRKTEKIYRIFAVLSI